ncbi:hypothetical protein ONS95_010090 [Cadophora gregata]|uniref:uncharacterized protein n=1 Tax=Cadophora gregata TaxID=51156 RepID=UPI0026DB5FFF|nr:uncharacterized protein ONS95_010090 [Cadophora gregata]KAK0121807.1 hypothetical protein ONS95_010090 [Cadophora gregata]
MSISPPWQHPRSQAHAIDRAAIRGKCEDRAAWELCLEIPPPRADSPRPVSMHPISPPSSLHKFVPRNQNISFVTMSSGNSDTQAPGIAWYFDSEPDEYHPSSESEKSAFARQPWRAHWPPKSDKAKLAWMHSEFPEVLVWMFDRTKPFDRPWREWARSGIAMKEKAGNVSSTQHSCAQVQYLNPEERKPSRSFVDDLIKTLHLKSILSSGISFLTPHEKYQTEKPYLSRLPSGTSLPRTNLVASTHQLDIFEISGHERSFTLATSGFEYAKSPIRVRQWNDSSVCSEYIPQMESWISRYLDCARVFIYAYNFRGFSSETSGKSTKTPFFRAHCDATPTSCLRRIQLFLPEFSQSSNQRVRYLNIWRPITTPQQDSPLALCDYRSLNPETDLVAADIIFPHYRDEAYEVLHNPNQRWFYKKGMKWDDVILFKLGDSDPGEASLCPHSAFMDPSVPTGTPARRSIEVRAIIIG